tara:strand:- start:619 stop:1206 length:588 start_codon:yes stop_codon:yes gene_type:complete
MANRVILGKRGTSDYGLYISRDGVNVADSTSTTPLSFNADAANGLMVQSYGQGLLLPLYSLPGGASGSFTFGGVSYTASDITITTGLNYDPAYAVRFCRVSDLSSGVATKVWSPHWYGYEETECVEEMDDGYCEEEDTKFYGGGLSAYLQSNNLIMENNLEQDDGNEPNTYNNDTVLCYSYVIFHCENFRNGASL